MTNTNKLKGRMTEMGYNLSSFADAVEISRPALRRKINGQVDFKVSEIERICRLLGIPQTEMCSYFFAANVPILETA